MNGWLCLSALIYIGIMSVLTYIKKRKILPLVPQAFLAGLVGISMYFGMGTAVIWQILIWSALVGAAILLETVYGYNQLFVTEHFKESIGESRPPKPFGNGYWS